MFTINLAYDSREKARHHRRDVCERVCMFILLLVGDGSKKW